jgi:hypothetical protein
MRLIHAIESLSLLSGLFVVGIISGLVALPVSRITSPQIRWVILCGFPLLLSYSLYWLPVWGGKPYSYEYKAWALACIGPWTLSGFVVSSVIEDWVQRKLKTKSRADA